MGTAIGSLGGIAVIEEVTYGTTPGTPTWIWQHPMASSLGLRRPVVEPNLLSYAAHTARGYSGKFVDGDLVVGLDLGNAVIGDILGTAGSFDIDHFDMGGGDVPDVNSLSVLMSYGGGGATPANHHEWIHTGVKPNAIRFNLEPESNSYLTLVGIGDGSTKTALASAETPNAPAETSVFMPSDLGTVTIGTANTCLHSATFEVLVPKTGFDRRCMGGTMREPITAGRPDVTWTINGDLDDDTDNDTIATLALFLAGTNLGTISIGTDFELSDCIMSGDFPALQEGQIDFSISGTASLLAVTVT